MGICFGVFRIRQEGGWIGFDVDTCFDCSCRNKGSLSGEKLSVAVDECEVSIDLFENRNVCFLARCQRAHRLLQAQSSGGIDCGSFDDLLEIEAECQEFRHRRG